jgi:hypothetical protein
MNKWIATSLCAAATLLMPVGIIAQDKPAQKEHTMSGCLQKGTGEGTFVVQNTAAKGPKMIGIVSSTANLAPHIGHKIDITGTAVPSKEAESMKPAPPKADHYMRLTAIKMVSTTCP